jgi:hypothetical protein
MHLTHTGAEPNGNTMIHRYQANTAWRSLERPYVWEENITDKSTPYTHRRAQVIFLSNVSGDAAVWGAVIQAATSGSLYVCMYVRRGRNELISPDRRGPAALGWFLGQITYVRTYIDEMPYRKYDLI